MKSTSAHVEQQVERFKKLVEGAFSPITKVLISLSKEGVSYSNDTPTSGSLRWGAGDGGCALTGGCGSPNLGPLGSSPGTWNLAWNFGR